MGQDTRRNHRGKCRCCHNSAEHGWCDYPLRISLEAEDAKEDAKEQAHAKQESTTVAWSTRVRGDSSELPDLNIVIGDDAQVRKEPVAALPEERAAEDVQVPKVPAARMKFSFLLLERLYEYLVSRYLVRGWTSSEFRRRCLRPRHDLPEACFEHEGSLERHQPIVVSRLSAERRISLEDTVDGRHCDSMGYLPRWIISCWVVWLTLCSEGHCPLRMLALVVARCTIVGRANTECFFYPHTDAQDAFA